jgi:hypothetical protein
MYHSANSQQPTANSQQPTANSQQPTANSQQPAAKHDRCDLVPFWGRKWFACRGWFEVDLVI